jgi:phage shock protein PspC (stress-responsive transcriptional regulator)
MELIYCVVAGAVGFVLMKVAWYVICILTLPDSNDIIHKDSGGETKDET